jgi:hypothetical protein
VYKRASKPKATCAYIQGSGWGLLTLKISFKHITGDYLDGKFTKATGKYIYETAEKTAQ